MQKVNPADIGLILITSAALLIRARVGAISSMVSLLLSSAWPLTMGIIGFICAKHDLLTRLHNRCTHIPAVIFFLAFAGLICLWNNLGYVEYYGGRPLAYASYILPPRNIIAVGTIISLAELLSRSRVEIVRRTLLFLGGISIYIWFIHGIFHSGKFFLRAWLYSSGNPLLIYASCLTVAVPVSYLMSKFSLPKYFKKAISVIRAN